MSRRANCSRPLWESVDDDLKAIFQRRRFSQPARPLHKPGGEEGGRHKDNHRHYISRRVDLEAEKRRAKKVIQACCSNNGEGDRGNDPAAKGQQHDDDYVDRNGRSDIEIEPEVDPGEKCKSGGAEQHLCGR
jgi:hypothetical protein